MLVSDTSLFTSSCKITVINNAGAEWVVETVAPELSIEQLKAMALSYFYSPGDITKSAALYKLVHLGEARQLDDNNTVFQEQLQNHGKDKSRHWQALGTFSSF